MTRLFQKGDVVKVWSLQSFFHGGFLNGADAVVSQDQHPERSVIVTVTRQIGGAYSVDPSYEVYPEQLRLVVERNQIPVSLAEQLDTLIRTAKNSQDMKV